MLMPLRSRSDRSPPQSPVKVAGTDAGGGSDRWPCARAGKTDCARKPKHSAAAANVHPQRRPAMVSIIALPPGVILRRVSAVIQAKCCGQVAGDVRREGEKIRCWMA